MGDSKPIGAVVFMGGQVGTANNLTKCTILRVVADGDDEMAVGSSKYAIGHDILMSIARSLRGDAGGHVVKVLVGQHRHLAIEQGQVNVLTQSALIAFVQGGKDGHRSVHS